MFYLNAINNGGTITANTLTNAMIIYSNIYFS